MAIALKCSACQEWEARNDEAAPRAAAHAGRFPRLRVAAEANCVAPVEAQADRLRIGGPRRATTLQRGAVMMSGKLNPAEIEAGPTGGRTPRSQWILSHREPVLQWEAFKV